MSGLTMPLHHSKDLSLQGLLSSILQMVHCDFAEIVVYGT